MREWMGLNEAANLPEKVAALRALGVPDDLVHLIEAHQEVRRYVQSPQFQSLSRSSSLVRAGGTSMSDDVVAHLMNVNHPNGNFLNNGLYGGHHTPRLLGWVAQHLEYELVEEAVRSAGGTQFRRYSQYHWIGNGPPPARGDVRRQPASLADQRLWQRSTQPKTTADDLFALMREADDAFSQWRAAYPGLARSGDAFGRGLRNGPPALSSNGVEVTGFYTYVPAQVTATPGAGGERFNVRTVFIEAQWF
jgi:hypothetical protein